MMVTLGKVLVVKSEPKEFKELNWLTLVEKSTTLGTCIETHMYQSFSTG